MFWGSKKANTRSQCERRLQLPTICVWCAVWKIKCKLRCVSGASNASPRDQGGGDRGGTLTAMALTRKALVCNCCAWISCLCFLSVVKVVRLHVLFSVACLVMRETFLVRCLPNCLIVFERSNLIDPRTQPLRLAALSYSVKMRYPPLAIAFVLLCPRDSASTTHHHRGTYFTGTRGQHCHTPVLVDGPRSRTCSGSSNNMQTYA